MPAGSKGSCKAGTYRCVGVGGGFLVIIGLFFRSACFFLLCAMVVVTLRKVDSGKPFIEYSHPLEAAVLSLSLLLIGPGKHSLDKK